MAVTNIERRPILAPGVKGLLGSLRAWIRCYVWLEGTAVAVAWLGAAFWGSLLGDWFFEPSVDVRIAVLAVVGAVLSGLLTRWIGRRTFVRLSDANMATLLERRYSQLHDSLLTAVVLTGREVDSAQCNPDMLQRTCREAARRIEDLGPAGVFDFRPLLRRLTAAGLLAASVACFAMARPYQFDTWVQRNLLLSTDPWPRTTCIQIEGFADGVEKVARGADFKVIAKAHTRWPPDHPHAPNLQRPVVPATVQIRYRVDGGSRQRQTMNRLGEARPDEDPFQKYAYTFPTVLAPITFSVKGNDHLVGEYRIQVVESPTIDGMELDYRYPDYMQRPVRTFPFTGAMQVPMGTRVTVRATANKDLVSVQVDRVLREDSPPPELLHIDDSSADRRSFSYPLPPLTEDTTLLLTLSDTDGITGRDPLQLALTAKPDEAPQLAVHLHGIGTAITAEADLPAVGSVTDDYGIHGISFDYQVDQQPPAESLIARPPGQTTDWKLDGTSPEVILEAAKLGLSPDQKLLVSVKASDHHRPQQNVGHSDRWLLDVVTPEQLRAMLELRELVLRRRFERIVEEVTETRDLLMRIELELPDAAGTPEESPKAEDPEAENPADGSALAEDNKPLTPEEHWDLQRSRTQQALHGSHKSSRETRGVAEAFDDVRWQFVNNKIHTPELIDRLKRRIADPLHKLVDHKQMFPELLLALQKLEEQIEDPQAGPQLRDRARRTVDEILTEMQRVLDQMIELQSFNEALKLLRKIIQLQQELGQQTKRRRHDSLRDLQED